MARYLWQASYSVDGIKGLLKEGGTSRRAVIEKLVSDLGGQVEAFYYASARTTCT
jgi:GYD domain